MTERTDLELKTIFDEAFDEAWKPRSIYGHSLSLPPATHVACRAVYEQGFRDGQMQAEARRRTEELAVTPNR